MRYAQILLLLLASQIGFSGYASAQSRSDTSSIVRALAQIIADEASRPGDHHGAFVWHRSTTSLWTRLVAIELRKRSPGPVAAADPNALYVTIDEVALDGDTARARVIWSRCTGPSDTLSYSLNYWVHQVTFHLIRSGKGWAPSGQQDVIVGDGRC